MGTTAQTMNALNKITLTALATGTLISNGLHAAEKYDNLEEVIIVYKSHFDIGYTRLASEVIHGYRTKTIEQALDVVDKNKNLPIDQQFIWTIPGWPMKKILEPWPGQTPERQQRVREAFKKGRFSVHALPFTMQTEMMEPEGMVRGLGYASQLARDAGKPLPTAAKMTDVPSHSQFTPTLLKHAGVNFLHLGCNPGSAPPQVPFLFWWQGPDGSRLLTMYSATYGNGLLPPPDWKYKTWIAMIMGSDNKPPPSPEKVRAHIKELSAKLPGVKIRIGSLSDFGDRMMKEDLSNLPVINKDMPDSWIHGPMCNPDGVILTRRAVPDLFTAESLHTLLGNWQVVAPNPTQALSDGYENSILYYEHTWGGAVDWIGKYASAKNYIGQMSNWYYGDKWKADLKTNKYDRHLASWEEHTDYARNASKFASESLNDAMQALAKAVDTNGSRTVIFNPLPWKRDAIVNGALVKNIPAGGYVTLSGKQNPPTSASTPIKSGNTHENQHFKITLDPARGAIRSLVDKRNGRELVDASAEHGFGQYLHEKFSADEIAGYCKAYIRGEQTEEDLYEYGWAYAQIGKPNLPPSSEIPYRALTTSNCTVTQTNQGNSTTLEMRATQSEKGVNYPVSTRILLHDDAPYIDLELTIEKPADIWPEAGWICLPFKIDSPRFRVGRNGFIMDPAHDIVPGANRYMYAVGTGVAIFDQHGWGVGICAPDTPLLSLGKPGCWKFDHTYVPEKPTAYFNLFNNQWTTNYRFWNEGKWTYRFRIWSFDHYDAATALITPSIEMRYPVQTATVDAPAGKLPTQQSGLRVSRSGTIVTALGKNPDGKGTLLRVWEQAGVSGMINVVLPKTMKETTITPVNLRGEVIGKTRKLRSNNLEFNLGAYAPGSFILDE
jgi:alpha-mannosidase